MSDIIRIFLYQPLYNFLILVAWFIPGHSLGWSIIILTILVRLILLPGSLKASRAQAHIQALQPKINEIRRKHKNQMEQSQALMTLYKEEGVSQFGACLPILIQLPFLLALYSVFRHIINGSISSELLYGFIPRPETISHFFLGLDLSKPELWILPALAGISQYIVTVMTMPPAPKKGEEQDQMMAMTRQMNYVLPIMTFIFGRQFPAAISLYWVVSTVIGIAQQWYINKYIKPQFQKEADIEVKEELREAASLSKSLEQPKPKKDFLSKVMEGRLAREEKRKGVSVTIRKKD